MGRHSDLGINGLAQMVNSVVRGWTNYYGRFYKSMLYPLLQCINEHLVRWAYRKYKRLHRRPRRARELLAKIARQYPYLFAHWRIGMHSPVIFEPSTPDQTKITETTLTRTRPEATSPRLSYHATIPKTHVLRLNFCRDRTSTRWLDPASRTHHLISVYEHSAAV
ncbi:MAG: hypothetical protein JO115_10665 [Pseudonocardiales bacterium]|nr:hypothetical protein [Pseudonocardiales bacterium]